MAQKHRFKKNREFKERITATEENDEGDIRSFKFHSLEKKFDKDGDKPRFARRGRDNDGDDRKFGGKFEKGDRKGVSKFGKKNFSKDFNYDE